VLVTNGGGDVDNFSSLQCPPRLDQCRVYGEHYSMAKVGSHASTFYIVLCERGGRGA
jgi:hypothetical protein